MKCLLLIALVAYLGTFSTHTHKHTDTPTFALTKMLANIKNDYTLANILAFAIKANLRAFCWREKLILKINLPNRLCTR